MSPPKSVQLVGILNITPDSFSDGGLYADPKKALARAEELLEQGASLIDLGAESTNPKSQPLGADAEWQRIEPILSELLHRYPGQVSVDSYHPDTIEQAALVGDIIINDVTGFNDPQMIRLAAEFNLTCIISHLPACYGDDIQAAHKAKPIDSINQVVDEMLARRNELAAAGVLLENIILDPGIGFGKTMPLNWKLLEFAKLVPDHAVMIGHSRKRFLGTNPQTGTPLPDADRMRFSARRNQEAAKIALEAGATYLRVHEPGIYSELVACS